MQLRLGWSEEAMIAGARDVGVSPSIVGSFPRKEAALVEVLFLNLMISNFFLLFPFNFRYMLHSIYMFRN
jgi:ubiquinone biosynthesis protein COQ9